MCGLRLLYNSMHEGFVEKGENPSRSSILKSGDVNGASAAPALIKIRPCVLRSQPTPHIPHSPCAFALTHLLRTYLKQLACCHKNLLMHQKTPLPHIVKGDRRKQRVSSHFNVDKFIGKVSIDHSRDDQDTNEKRETK